MLAVAQHPQQQGMQRRKFHRLDQKVLGSFVEWRQPPMAGLPWPVSTSTGTAGSSVFSCRSNCGASPLGREKSSTAASGWKLCSSTCASRQLAASDTMWPLAPKEVADTGTNDGIDIDDQNSALAQALTCLMT